MNKKIIILLLVLVIITGAVFFGLSLFSKKGKGTWVSSEKLMKKGEIGQPGKILEVTFDYDKNATPELAIAKLAIKNGFVPAGQDQHKDYTVNLYDAQKTLIKTLPFDIPDEHSDSPEETMPTGKLSFVVTLDFPPLADTLEVVSASGAVIISKKLENISTIDNKPNFKILNQNTPNNGNPISFLKNIILPIPTAFAAGDGYVDIVFTGERYPNIEALEADISSYKNALESLEPFKSRKSQLRYYHINVFNGGYCSFDPNTDFFPSCDEAAVVQAVNDASVPYDKIAIILNNSDGSFEEAGFGGMAQFSQPCCAKLINQKSTYPDATTGPFLFVHELGGHLLGGLNDEYIGTNQPIQENCYNGIPPNPAWADTVALRDYRQPCSTQSWYRSYPVSIMDNSPDAHYFNAPSQKRINEKFDAIIGGSFTNANAPTASISSPAAGANVFNTVNVQTSLSDDLGIARANLYVNGILYQTAYEAPFSFSWDTTEFNNGSYTLEVKAYDVPGINPTSVTVTVNVNNAAGSRNLKVTVKKDTSEGKNKIFLNAGSYSIIEEYLSNWDVGSVTCDKPFTPSAEGATGVTVVSGQVTTCTFNNLYTDRGSIKVVKKSIGGYEAFSFDSNFGVASLTTNESNNGTASQTIPDLLEGSNYYISETNIPEGWELSALSCNNGASETRDGTGLENIAVVAGETTICTFTNIYTICADPSSEEGVPFN